VLTKMKRTLRKTRLMDTTKLGSGQGKRICRRVRNHLQLGSVKYLTYRMDKLENIFELQDVLNKRIGVNMDELNDEERANWILNYVRAMQQELAELTDSVPWKWWAKYQDFDKQNAKVEIVDLFHFLISLAQVMGMTADDVHQAYLKKNEVNHKRQESGYSTKDENDSRHI
jgi:dimeric dUTPase (all-alpha-NTP-PPase superfamily)